MLSYHGSLATREARPEPTVARLAVLWLRPIHPRRSAPLPSRVMLVGPLCRHHVSRARVEAVAHKLGSPALPGRSQIGFPFVSRATCC